MSSRRSGSRITEDDLNELVAKLQSLLPEARRRSMGRVCSPCHPTDPYVLLITRANAFLPLQPSAFLGNP